LNGAKASKTLPPTRRDTRPATTKRFKCCCQIASMVSTWFQTRGRGIIIFKASGTHVSHPILKLATVFSCNQLLNCREYEVWSQVGQSEGVLSRASPPCSLHQFHVAGDILKHSLSFCALTSASQDGGAEQLESTDREDLFA
jgi:hypothetical protein